jgi:hypothetical protein
MYDKLLVNHIDQHQTSIKLIGIIVDGVCRRIPSSRRAVSSFKVNIKPTKSLKFRFGTVGQQFPKGYKIILSHHKVS